MLLAEQEFLVLLYAFLVVYDVRAALPKPPSSSSAASASAQHHKQQQQQRQVSGSLTDVAPPEGIGGGVAIGEGTLLARPSPVGSAIAIIADPRAPARRGEEEGAGEDGDDAVPAGIRYHLVKGADMFTQVDGVIPYTISARRASER